jgi:radial spoke head protein 4A
MNLLVVNKLLFLYRKFENIYIGWGQKYATENFNPQLPPQPQEEFVSGPEITEAEDPSPQDEAALKKAQEAAEAEDERGEEEEEEGDAEEEDD